MDPLTHSATGIFLSRSGLDRYSPHALWILLLAANAPDVDVVTAFGGSLDYLNYHRHLTHSLLMLPLVAVLPLLVVRLATRKPLNWKGAYAISVIGVASHLALDYTNIYGIRLFLPASSRWYQLDITSVIDLWIWAAILIALVGPVLARLVYSEIGAKSGSGRGFAIFALGFLLFYNCGRALLHQRAVATLESRIYMGAAPAKVIAIPGPANPFDWRGVVETRQFYDVLDVNLLGDFDPTRGRIFFKPVSSPAIDAASRTRTFRDFLNFAQYPLWRVLPVADPQNGLEVEAMDIRFGTPARPSFVATAILDSRLNVLRSWFRFAPGSPR